MIHSLRHKRSNESGFTLFETLLYIALVTILMLPLTALLWTFLGDQVQQERRTEITDIGTGIITLVSDTTRSSAGIDETTTYDDNPGQLVLDDDGTTVVFDTYTKSITVGDQPVDIRALRMTRGASEPVDLTTDEVNVDEFVITDISPSGATSIELQLKISSVNPSNSRLYYGEYDWTTTITLRR